MTDRLGNVLYWLGCLAAVALAAAAIWIVVATGERNPGFIAFVSWPAVVAWLAGRAARYVLSGR